MGKIVYKIDVLRALKAKGITSYTLRKGDVLGGATVQKIRRGEIVNAANLSKLCQLLCCQPGDLLGYVEDSSEDAQASQAGTSPTT